MHVFINDGNERCWLTDVHLKEGFCPHIGNQSKRQLKNDASIEPAIWCKVLILDSISIDCSRRVLRWCTGSSADEEDDSRNQYCINEECSGYDTEDELFDLARAIIDRSRQDGGEDDSKMSIVRMLHCFVLPKVTFHRNDTAKVEHAKNEQLKSIKTLDIKLKEKCNEVSEGQEELYAKQEQFLPNIEDLVENNNCDKQFLEMLLQDLKQEEKRIRKQIDEAQDEVEAARKPLSSGKRSSSGVLYQAREKRNLLNDKLEFVVTAREQTVEGLDYVKQGTCKEPVKVLQEYADLRNKVERIKEERCELIQQKNCALSVREMLEAILDDLNTKGFSEANDADSKGHRATDVLQNVWNPEWQKLSERVATIVYNPEHPVGNSFEKFCSEVHELCQEIIALGQPNETSMDIPGSMSTISIGSHEVPSEDRLGTNSYGLSDYVVDSYRDRLSQLRNMIFSHLEKMTGLLSVLFKNNDTPFRNKLRLAYEHCFYEREHQFIECVYERAHHEHVANLETDIKRLKKLPIKLLKLPMKDEWWHEIFEQRVQICELNAQIFQPLAASMSSLENGNMNGHQSGKVNGDSEMNGDFSSNESSDEALSEDDLDGLEVDFPITINTDKKHYLDTMSVRSFFINTVRNRSRTFHHGYSSDDSDSEDGVPKVTSKQTSLSCGPQLSSSAPANSKLSLGNIIDQWQGKDETDRQSFQRKPSQSYHELSKTKTSEPSCTLQQGDTFEDHFGPALQHMKDMFKAVSPVAKLKCLTASLRKIAAKVSELRMRDGQDSFSSAVTAEDLLPLLILMMLQMDPCDAASMWPQLAMLEDLMAPCLGSGCHGWALVEFQMAQRILVDLCNQF